MNHKLAGSLLVGIGIMFAFGAMKEVAPNADTADATLIDLEKNSWQAWKNRDADFYKTFLSDDHVEISAGGVSNKLDVLETVASPICQVKNFQLEQFKLTKLADGVALLTYRAMQETLCRGRPLPTPVWVSSLYVLRQGRWVNAAYQQTPVAKPEKS